MMGASEYRASVFNEDEAMRQLLSEGIGFDQASRLIGRRRTLTGQDINRMIDEQLT